MFLQDRISSLKDHMKDLRHEIVSCFLRPLLRKKIEIIFVIRVFVQAGRGGMKKASNIIIIDC